MVASLGFLCLAYGYADYALYTTDDTLPGAELTAWLTNWLFMVPVFIAPCFLFLRFPDGRPASPRWRRHPALSSLRACSVIRQAGAQTPAAVVPGRGRGRRNIRRSRQRGRAVDVRPQGGVDREVERRLDAVFTPAAHHLAVETL